MDGWWSEVERDILSCLREQGSTSPAAIARQLKMSEAAATSLLAALACEGKLRIEAVAPLGPFGRMPAPRRGPSLRARGPEHGGLTAPPHPVARPRRLARSGEDGGRRFGRWARSAAICRSRSARRSSSSATRLCSAASRA
jgi:hypothetical protein